MTREELLKKAKPILFKKRMVQLILDEMKTTTRRVVKGYIPDDATWGYTMFTPKGYISCRGMYEDEHGEKFFKLPCKKGDILYVRETVWQKTTHSLEIDGETRGYFLPDFRYVATDTKPKAGWNYSWVKRPSIHMPKEAARIFLKVTDIRVERLQDITESGAHEEGFEDDIEYGLGHPAKYHFANLWDTTIKKSKLKKYGWKANPWVWVIEFKRLESGE